MLRKLNKKNKFKLLLILSLIICEFTLLIYIFGLHLNILYVVIPAITIFLMLKKDYLKYKNNLKKKEYKSNRIFSEEDRIRYTIHKNEELNQHMIIFGIKSNSDLNKKFIKKRYIELAKKYHPDINNLDSELMIKVNHSYEYLIKYIRNR